MRGLPYLRFANVVARARREVLREPECRPAHGVSVIAYSVDASVVDSATGLAAEVPWGEFWPPNGPVVIWQHPYEVMPDQKNYYRQIKAVLRHEFRHALGDHAHDEDRPGTIYARVRQS